MSKPGVTWQIESQYGTTRPDGWSSIGWEETANEFKERQTLKSYREKNLHRDDKTRAQTRPCTIWTPDGTWASYRSAATNYRLVRITREVVDEDENYDPSV